MLERAESTDVLVIGGGVLGCASAGEREGYFAATNRLYVEAAHMWSGLEAELQTDLGVRIVGGLMVAESEDELRELTRKAAYEQSIGMETWLLSQTELARMAPNLSTARGCASRRGCWTSRPVPGGGGFTVATNAGQIQARRIVIAAGAHTRQVTQMVGLELPILQHPLQVLVSQPVAPILEQLIQHAGNRHLSMRQTQYGTFVIGGGWPAIEPPLGERLAVRARSLAGNASVACDVLPALREVPMARAWAGMTTSTGGWGFTASPYWVG